MGFVLATTGTYQWPVDVKVPKPDGTFEKVDFIGEFHRLPQSRIDEIQEIVQAQAAGIGDAENPLKDDDILDEVFAGWSGVTDPSGNVLQVTPENRAVLLEVAGVKIGILGAWFQVVKGIERKNSSPPQRIGASAAATTEPSKTSSDSESTPPRPGSSSGRRRRSTLR